VLRLMVVGFLLPHDYHFEDKFEYHSARKTHSRAYA
jgi:hypothetical protein